MVEQSGQAPSGSPDWIADSVRSALGELLLFFRTAAAFTLRPGRFAKEWVGGRRRALNPLAFLATSAALLGGLRALFHGAFPASDDGGGLTGQIADAVAPYLHYAALGVIAHFVFVLCGSRGVRLRESLAVALYAGGGPAALADIAVAAVSAAYLAVRGEATTALLPSSPWGMAMAATAVIVFSVFSWALATALVALHGQGSGLRRFASVTAALLVSYAATGALFGALQPPGHYGLHWDLRFAKGADGKRDFSIGLGIKD
jgi:hypothetical protein